jgi:hypothetical protein
MKTPKIMLTALLVLALVGGALAYKAKKYANICYYEANVAGQCHILAFGTKIGAETTVGAFNTTRIAPCPTVVADCNKRHLVLPE